MRNIRRIVQKLSAVVLSLMLILALCPVLALADADSAAQDYGATNVLPMPESGKLKIAVFSDVQDTQSVSTDIIACMEKILDEQQPDLVVFLGDQAEGRNPWLHFGNGEKNVKKIIDTVLAPVVAHNLPFTVVFGNHDSLDAGVAKEVQMAYYESFPGCLAKDEGEALPGCGTYDIVYTNKDGTPALHLYFVDSGEYAEDGSYASVSEEQSQWYVERAEALKKANGGKIVPGYLFQHIIVPEIYNVLQETQESKTAIKGQCAWEDRYWTTPADGSFYGYLGEGPCPPNASTQFSYWQQEGDITAAFFGHDHINSYVAKYEGIDLVACPGMTYASYNNSNVRGARMIEISADGSYETKTLQLVNYEEKGIAADARRIFQNPWVTLGITVILAVAVVITGSVLGIKKLCRKKKEQQAQAETADN